MASIHSAKLAFGRPREPGAEKGVDDHGRVVEPRLVQDLDARPSASASLSRAAAPLSRPASMQLTDRQAAPSMEMARGGEPVAGVVAHTADHGGSAETESRDLPAGGLHEPVDRDAEALLRQGVDLG